MVHKPRVDLQLFPFSSSRTEQAKYRASAVSNKLRDSYDKSFVRYRKLSSCPSRKTSEGVIRKASQLSQSHGTLCVNSQASISLSNLITLSTSAWFFRHSFFLLNFTRSTI